MARVIWSHVGFFFWKRGHELKIAAVQEGWEKNGQRKRKRYYLHQGNGSFWEGLEAFLMANYDYDPTFYRCIMTKKGYIR